MASSTAFPDSSLFSTPSSICSQFGAEDLERHIAVVFEIAGEMDDGHTADAEFTLDCVATEQRTFQTIMDIDHFLYACA